MRSLGRDRVLAIEQVTQAVAVVETSQNVIVTAVEAQRATNSELGRSIDRLARTSSDITRTITTVREAAKTTALDADASQQSAAQIQTLVDELSHLMDTSIAN